MNVLMLSHYFEQRRGGIEIVAAALARELASRGFGMAWLATGEAQPQGESTDLHRESLPASNALEALLGIPYPVLHPRAWGIIFRRVRAADVVLVHDALYMTSFVAYWAARVWRKPLVVVQHVGTVPYRRALLRALMNIANRLIAAPVLREASSVVFISETTRQYFSTIRWRSSPVLIFNGVDTEVFHPPASAVEVERARHSLELPPDVPIALFVGRFVEKKGLHILEEMARARPDILFAFAGRGPLDPSTWKLDNVRIYASLSGSSLAALYGASDVFLLPSVGEGFPLVVQEALACGLPVICGSDTSRADPRIEACLHGVVVDLTDPQGTARRFLAEMTRHLSRRTAFEARRRRFELAQSTYSWAAAAARYAEILLRLSSGCASPHRDGVPGDL